ncbi:MAG: hypothetical protein ACRDLT_09195 [Solirubrobacteraceae bacterium]
MGKIVIVSSVPGRIRGGMAHPAAAEHAIGSIAREALQEIAADPRLTVVVGDLVTADNLGALLDANDKAWSGGETKARLKAK